MADEVKQHQELTTQKNVGQTIRLIAALFLVAITLALVFDNRGDVTIGWAIGDTTAPLALALALTFVLGLVVGWLGAHHRRR